MGVFVQSAVTGKVDGVCWVKEDDVEDVLSSYSTRHKWVVECSILTRNRVERRDVTTSIAMGLDMTRVAPVTIARRRERRLRQRKHGDDDGDGAGRPSATRRRKHPPDTPFVRLPRDAADVATLSSLSTASPPVHNRRHPLPTDVIDSVHVMTIVSTRKI